MICRKCGARNPGIVIRYIAGEPTDHYAVLNWAEHLGGYPVATRWPGVVSCIVCDAQHRRDRFAVEQDADGVSVLRMTAESMMEGSL